MADTIPKKEQSLTGPKTAPAKKAPAKKAPAKAAPGKAVAKVTPKKSAPISDFTPAKAKALTEKIKKSATTTFEDITKAYAGRIWLALDCKSWDEYVDKHYEGVAFALPREKKKQAIQSLAAAGMSSRAIAAATDVSQSTAARAGSKVTDPAPAESNDSRVSGATGDVIDVPPEDITELSDGENAPEAEGRTVQGKDGKNYTVTAKEPVVVNVVSVARNLSKELDNVRIRLESLFSREDYEENKVAVQGTLETAVGDIIDSLVEEFADLISERIPQPEPEPAV